MIPLHIFAFNNWNFIERAKVHWEKNSKSGLPYFCSYTMYRLRLLSSLKTGLKLVVSVKQPYLNIATSKLNNTCGDG
jgi:hypothetical protein